MFFVISGFIIPYALMRAGYQMHHFGTFILKRIIRLDPPYLVSILIVIALEYASQATPGFHGPPFHFSLAQLVLHLGYLNVFFGYPWLNPVFWTLAIELQYYLLVGMLFFFIAHRSVKVRSVCFAALAASALLVPASQFVFHWLFVFMLGMVAFQFRCGLHPKWQFFLWTGILGAGAFYANGWAIASLGVVTAWLLGLFDSGSRNPLLFLGHISYSLYLLHVPVGGRVINLSVRFVHGLPGKCLVLVLALAVSVLAAWLLYRYVERPAQQWSSRIRYREKRVVVEINETKS